LTARETPFGFAFLAGSGAASTAFVVILIKGEIAVVRRRFRSIRFFSARSAKTRRNFDFGLIRKRFDEKDLCVFIRGGRRGGERFEPLRPRAGRREADRRRRFRLV
jgi:hypothetical protein